MHPQKQKIANTRTDEYFGRIRTGQGRTDRSGYSGGCPKGQLHEMEKKLDYEDVRVPNFC